MTTLRRQFKEARIISFGYYSVGIGLIGAAFAYVVSLAFPDSPVIKGIAGTIALGCLAIGIVWGCRKIPRLNLSCGKCGKHVPSDQIWVCGSCDAINSRTSFLDGCAECQDCPSAYLCPHCDAPMFLGYSEDERNAATKYVIQPHPISEDEQYAKDLQRIRRDIERTRLLTAKAHATRERMEVESTIQARFKENKADPIEDELKRLEEIARYEEVTADWWDKKEGELLEKWRRRGVDDSVRMRRLARIKAAILGSKK
jgi:hypothetical protein